MRAHVLVAAGLIAGGVPAAALAQPASADGRRSGFDAMSPATQAMQRDDSLNPAMLWAREGEALWQQSPAPGAPACAGCHPEPVRSMRGVAVRYPAVDAASGGIVNLAGRINLCRQRHQGQAPLPPASETVLALEAWVALQSRGMPLSPSDDPQLARAGARGQTAWTKRMGQLNLSCDQCHDERAGASLGGTRIPQGHPTAYPVYRLEWQTLGNLQRRLRNCLNGVRAELPPPADPSWLDLEVFLARRAAGMRSESPGVRP